MLFEEGDFHLLFSCFPILHRNLTFQSFKSCFASAGIIIGDMHTVSAFHFLVDFWNYLSVSQWGSLFHSHCAELIEVLALTQSTYYIKNMSVTYKLRDE